MSGPVGICVVYLVDQGTEFLFHKHLEQIGRCSAGREVTIYAGVGRLEPRYVEVLRGTGFVRICELAPTNLRNSFEHAHYLDQLAAIAFADGAARIGTLDVDSFPVAEDWLDRSDAMLDQGAALVGVLRRENGDVAAPHPSFMYFDRGLYERHRPTFGLMRDDPRGAAFLKASGQPRLDTGAGYAVTLFEQKLRWAALTRSNKVDDHPLMAGVYGDMIFHFGGGSRDKVFSVDVSRARRTRPGATLEELWPGIAAANEAIAQRALAQMGEDFDGYIDRLLGRGAASPPPRPA